MKDAFVLGGRGGGGGGGGGGSYQEGDSDLYWADGPGVTLSPAQRERTSTDVSPFGWRDRARERERGGDAGMTGGKDGRLIPCMYPRPHMTCMYPTPHMTCMYPPHDMRRWVF